LVEERSDMSGAKGQKAESRKQKAKDR
jgi:hypothetical protein